MSGRESAVIVDTYQQPHDKLMYYLLFDNSARTSTITDAVTYEDGAGVQGTYSVSVQNARPLSQYLKDVFGNYALPKYAAGADKRMRIPLFGDVDRFSDPTGTTHDHQGMNVMALLHQTSTGSGGSGDVYESLHTPGSDTITTKVDDYSKLYYSCLRKSAGRLGDYISLPELTELLVKRQYGDIHLLPDFGFTPTSADVSGGDAAKASAPKVYSDSDSAVVARRASGPTANMVDLWKDTFTLPFDASTEHAIPNADTAAGAVTKTYDDATALDERLVPAFKHETGSTTVASHMSFPCIGGGFLFYKSNETCPVFCLNVPKDYAVVSWEFEYHQFTSGSDVKVGDVFTSTSPTMNALNLHKRPVMNFLHVPV